MTDIPMPPEMVPADEHVKPRAKRSNLRVVLVVVAVVTAVLIVGASTIKISYFTQSPGSAVGLDELITVDGTEFFMSDGEIFFTTVRLTGEITILEYLLALNDSAVEIRPSSEVLGGQTREEQREQNRQAMVDSQDVSIRVALEQLGFDVIVERGALISNVLEGSGSEGVLSIGDVVVSADGTPVAAGPGLVEIIRSLEPGDDLMLTIERPREVGAPEMLQVVVVLGENDSNAQLGVGVTTALDLVELPFEVNIATASVGGPSAGLALTLATLDLLTEGELTGGLEVATTGTIDIFGNVGPIGGAEQKGHAVRRAGIAIFLVPPQNLEEAKRGAGDDVDVVAVATIEAALQVLAERGGATDVLDVAASAP